MEEMKSIADVIKKISHSGEENKNINNNFDFTQFQIDKYNKAKIQSDVYQCDKCGNKGIIALKGDNDKIVYKQCSCYKIRLNRKRMKDLGLLDFVVSNDSDNTDNTNIQKEEWEIKCEEKINDYCNNNSNGFWFFIGGAVGSGKTTKCSKIISNMINKNLNLLADYINWDTSYKDIINCERDFNKLSLKSDIVEHYKNVDILYIDDFLRHKNPEQLKNDERDLAKCIIDYRYRNKKITLISSELYYQEIEEMDEAIASRIYQMCDKGKYLLNIKRDKNRNYRKKKDLGVL